MTPNDLARVVQIPEHRAKKWADHVSSVMALYSISTPLRQAAFLAQISHESGSLAHVRELWGPTDAQERYEGREDLGNTQPGDGYKFRGRGLIQITGRANYAETSEALFGDARLLGNPATLEEPVWAAMSAAEFWTNRGLNALADKRDMRAITRIINGGYNGLPDRMAKYATAVNALLTT